MVRRSQFFPNNRRLPVTPRAPARAAVQAAAPANPPQQHETQDIQSAPIPYPPPPPPHMRPGQQEPIFHEPISMAHLANIESSGFSRERAWAAIALPPEHASYECTIERSETVETEEVEDDDLGEIGETQQPKQLVGSSSSASSFGNHLFISATAPIWDKQASGASAGPSTETPGKGIQKDEGQDKYKIGSPGHGARKSNVVESWADIILHPHSPVTAQLQAEIAPANVLNRENLDLLDICNIPSSSNAAESITPSILDLQGLEFGTEDNTDTATHDHQQSVIGLQTGLERDWNYGGSFQLTPSEGSQSSTSTALFDPPAAGGQNTAARQGRKPAVDLWADIKFWIGRGNGE
ncbi:hypothetical protein TWF694_002265 [Orbilia ellipsospora]|uniref:Uncharacterized protein n=1 Tax=Orbilia ellipsospora TaxID=2528407 RepID=A0AAV9X2P6_9PEZI